VNYDMEENKLVKYEHGQLRRIGNVIAVANKLLQTKNTTEGVIAIQEDADYYFRQGHQDRYSKKYVEAILEYDEAIKIDPNFSLAFEYRGLSKYELGDYKGATLDYTKAIVIGVSLPYYRVYILRGIAEINLGRLEEAILDFDKAIEIDPNNPQPYNHRGYAKEKLGKIKEAKLNYEKAIELEPGYKDATENLLRLKAKI
jgi:tetratricopeptide (TPR) repeat protein